MFGEPLFVNQANMDSETCFVVDLGPLDLKRLTAELACADKKDFPFPESLLKLLLLDIELGKKSPVPELMVL